MAGGWLMRRERRLLVGSLGGSAHYIYQLGRRGLVLFGSDSRTRRTDVLHSLAIADCYVEAKRLERAGVLTIDGYSTEPDSWQKIGRHELKPDLRLDVTRRDGLCMKLWLECDMATEGKRQVRDKLVRYWSAVTDADDPQWLEEFRVVWVACDPERATELRWIIDEGKDSQARQYFTVTTVDKLAGVFLRPVEN